MAGWSYEQNFDTYSTGNLGGQDSWVYVTGPQAQVQGSVFVSSPYSVSVDPDLNPLTYRNITAATDDGSICYVSMRVNGVATVDNTGLLFADGTFYFSVIYINAPNAADISLRDVNVGTYQNLTTGASANTWYRIGVEFDFTNDRIRGNINNGTMSSWLSTNAFTQVSRIAVNGNNGGAFDSVGYFDNISATYSVSTSSIKSIAGVPQASIKSIAGVAIASIKSVAGVTNT